MQLTIEPKPIRLNTNWMSMTAFKNSDLAPQGLNLLIERSKVVCRDCFGFGHSKQTCPTAIRLDQLRETNLLAKSAIGQVRAMIPIEYKAVADLPKWPFALLFDKWF